MSRAPDSSDGASTRPAAYRRTRRRWWLLLWCSAAIWLASFAGLMRGWWGFEVFGIVSAACLIAAGWSNHRLVSLERFHKSGRCWRCGYDLRGGRAARCPECGEAAQTNR